MRKNDFDQLFLYLYLLIYKKNCLFIYLSPDWEPQKEEKGYTDTLKCSGYLEFLAPHRNVFDYKEHCIAFLFY